MIQEIEPRLSQSRILVGKSPTDKNKSYEIVEYRGFLSPAECATIIADAESVGLRAAETLDTGNAALSSYNPTRRSSKTCWIDDSAGALYRDISRIASMLSGRPIANNEPLQVAVYDAGGKFDEHFDACDSTADVCERFNKGAGQRISTLLIYLGDDYRGGRTTFTGVRPNVSVEPETGKAIFFRDSAEDGQPIPESKHRGDPVRDSKKWICTKWTHADEWTHTGS